MARHGRAAWSRRRFLGLGGVTILSLAGSSRAWATPGRVPGVGIDLGARVVNGHDLPLASLLEHEIAPAHPEHAALVRAAAPVAQALAWALGPSAAAETWRLDELARRGVGDLSTSDAPEIHGDRAEADRRFRDALGVVLPGTEFFRRYLRHAEIGLGRSAAARLGRLADAGALEGDDVEALLRGERAATSIRALHAMGRYATYRYLGVRDRLAAGHADGQRADLAVPAMAPPVSGPGGPPSPPGDQAVAVARMVPLFAGRMHPLVAWEPEGAGALARVQDAVLRGGFVGVTLPPGSARRVPPELLAWCEEEDVPIVIPGAAVSPWGSGETMSTVDAASLLGLHRGRRTRARLEDFYERHAMAEPAWMRALDAAA